MPRTEEASQRIRDERREEILEAAVRVFARKGLAAAKIADIAAAAGVSHGLVYHYFASKEAIFAAAVERALQGSQWLAEAAAAHPGSPLAKIAWYVEQLLGGLRNQPQHAIVVTQALTSDSAPQAVRQAVFRESDATQAVIGRLIREGQAAGEIAEGDPAQLTLLFLTLVMGLSVSATFFPSREFAQFDVDGVLRLLRKEGAAR